MSEVESCVACGRPRWVDGTCMTIDHCVKEGDDICALLVERNNLVFVLRDLLGNPSVGAQRTARSVLEHYVHMGNVCPVCTHSVPLGADGTLRVHFTSGVDKRPCAGSYRTIDSAKAVAG